LNGDLYKTNFEFEKVFNLDISDSRLNQLTFFDLFETIEEIPLKSIKNTPPGK